jgi:DNA uptake protein ComE-like DNA-binding protein
MRRTVLLIGIAGGLLIAAGLWISRSQPDAKAVRATAAVDETSRITVDVNSASREALLSVPGMSPDLAEQVIRHRPYRKLDDLVTRKVLGKKEFARIREHIVIRRGS